MTDHLKMCPPSEHNLDMPSFCGCSIASFSFYDSCPGEIDTLYERLPIREASMKSDMQTMVRKRSVLLAYLQAPDAVVLAFRPTLTALAHRRLGSRLEGQSRHVLSCKSVRCARVVQLSASDI